MRARKSFITCAAALLSLGCADQPGDGPGGGFALDPAGGAIFNLFLIHHPLQGVGSAAEPSDLMLSTAIELWKNQCHIEITHDKRPVKTLMGKNANGQSVRLGERYDDVTFNGTPIQENVDELRNNMYIKNPQTNKGVELFYSHNIYNAGYAKDGIRLGPRFSIAKGGQTCTSSTCKYVPAHELGHQLNLPHRKDNEPEWIANYWLMAEDGSRVGPNLHGKKTVNGQVEFEELGRTECYVARRFGLASQYFQQLAPTGMTP